MRIIKSAPYRAHTEPLFQELNILPFYKIFQYSVIIFMFKCFNNMLPPLFAQLYLKNCDLHNYDTRNSNQLATYKFNTSAMQKSFLNTSIVYWNKINDHLDTNSSLTTFKKHLRKYLLFNEFIV